LAAGLGTSRRLWQPEILERQAIGSCARHLWHQQLGISDNLKFLNDRLLAAGLGTSRHFWQPSGNSWKTGYWQLR